MSGFGINRWRCLLGLLLGLAGTSFGDELGEIAGTGVLGFKKDDPGAQGWRTEDWSKEIMGRLRVLKEGLLEDQLESALAEISAKNCQISEVRAGEFDQVDERVRRWKSHDRMVSVEFGFQALMKFFAEGKPDHAKAKIVKITAEGEERAGVEILLQMDGPAAESGKALQINSRWESAWSKASGSWKIGELKLLAYEEVRVKKGLFIDVTVSALEDQDGLQKQFYFGQDHWMARVEMSHGIDVGGWQGVAVADVDGDGLEDLYVCQPGGLPNKLLKHQADGTVEDISAQSGVDWLEGSHGSLFCDLDNDGDPDLVVGVGFGVILMENDGAGKFSVKGTKLLTDGLPYSIAAADIDQDGDLDFFVCGYNPRGGVSRHHVFAHPVPYHEAENGGRNAMFRNDGSWRFRDVTKQVGMGEHNTRFSYAASWEDEDLDGDLDLYVANDFGKNNLYRNQLAQTGRVFFEDVAEDVGVVDVAPGMSVSWGDYNNDGRSDLYVGNMFSSAGNRIARQAQFHANADADTKSKFLRHANGNSLYKNLGGGNYADVGDEMGVNLGRWAWASKFVDLDNDGWLDLVVANGFVTQEDTGDL